MEFETQIREIEAEPDLARKALRLAMLVAAAFRAIGYETVVVGGSAIEFFTDGDYMSGDVDICFRDRSRPALRVIGDVMARLGAKGSSVRTFQVAGLFVDILGEVESLARTEFRRIASADGRESVLVAKPEDLPRKNARGDPSVPKRRGDGLRKEASRGVRPRACGDRLGRSNASGGASRVSSGKGTRAACR
jgi:hypothetical protein